MQGMTMSYSILKQTVPVTVATKKIGPNIPLEDIPHHTEVHGKLIAPYSGIFEISVGHYKDLRLLMLTPSS
jgi:hypothetical protein